METLLENFLNIEVILRYLPDIMSGMWVTLQLGFVVIITGLIGGLFYAMGKSFRIGLLSGVLSIYADMFRAMPPLVFMVFMYFGLPVLGVKMSGFVVSWLTLSIILTAFSGELIWAGLLSLSKGQREAARATGLSEVQSFIYVTLPQAIRLVIAPLTSRVISITKQTSLASVVAVPEILSQASAAQGYSANASPLTAAALGYLMIMFPLVLYSRYLEKRYGWKH